MKKTKSIFALTLCSVLALGTSAHADYVLRLKPRFGCPAGQILYLGACILEANIPNQNNQGGNQGGNEGPGDNPGGNQGENPSTDPTTTCEVENCASCVTDQSNACDTCDDGYHTQNGACVEDCTSNSCGTHETCNNSTHECECATGYTGDNCASCDENYHMKNNACVANCTSNSCDAGMGKTCNTTTHECECATGYTKSGDSCALCDRGTYKDHVGNDACSSCPGGTYSEIGAASCTSCPAGTYETRSAPNGEYCTQCPANTYSAVGATTCTPCPNNGTSPAGSTSESACVAAAPTCENGTIDDGTCYCNEGYTKDNGICVACEAGTYKDGGGNDICMPCPNGTYSSGTANTGCTPCPNNADCSSKTGFSCNANYYANGSSCTPCPNNGTSPAGSTSVSACVAAAPACDRDAAKTSEAACTACGGRLFERIAPFVGDGNYYSATNSGFDGCCWGKIVSVYNIEDGEKVEDSYLVDGACCSPESSEFISVNYDTGTNVNECR